MNIAVTLQGQLVRPRVRWPGMAAVLLTDLVQPLLESGRGGLVNIFGMAGSGKSTALLYLRQAIKSAQLFLIDESVEQTMVTPGPGQVMVYVTTAQSGCATVAAEMAPWGEDDLIEYVLARHRASCKSIMARLKQAGEMSGLPAECAAIVEAFARDEGLREVMEALRQAVLRELGEEGLHQAAANARRRLLEPRTKLQKLIGLSRHAQVQAALVSALLAKEINGGNMAALKSSLPRGLIIPTGKLLSIKAEHELQQWVISEPECQSDGIELLLAANPATQPRGAVRNLKNIHAAGAVWPGVLMPNALLTLADLSHANLTAADMTEAVADGIKLKGARMDGAILRKAFLDEGDLSGANLTNIDGTGASFEQTALCGTKFNGAKLRNATFDFADLTQCDMSGADLRGAMLRHIKVDGAIFERADLTGAIFLESILSAARWEGTVFRRCRCFRCDFENVGFDSPVFDDADMSGSDFTGTRMSGASFQNARLVRCGLAFVEWEGADLRGADFTFATFQMGTTRSGIVGSALASEGTRTGFYTDDYCDQNYKDPKLIRKANLCGCDLRGAKVHQTDFYLVDLRGAVYTREQGQHLANCGAILHG